MAPHSRAPVSPRPPADKRPPARRPTTAPRAEERGGERAGGTPPPQSSRRRAEEKICGQAAVRALARARPDDLIRLSLEASLAREFGSLLRDCAARRLAYHLVSREDLDAIAETTHHEGICAIARARPIHAFDQWRRAFDDPARARTLVALDGVRNPHNLGAIFRVCAHFGVGGVLIGASQEEGLPPTRFPPAVYRTAEGGLEALVIGVSTHLERDLRALAKDGYQIVATCGQSGTPLFETTFADRLVLVLGSEAEGLSRGVRAAADTRVTIPGTGSVESLNVACAASSLLCEVWRVQQSRGRGSGGPPDSK